MTAQPVVALDIGSTKVACAIGSLSERAAGLELLGSALIPYPVSTTAWLADPVTVSRAIEQALEATGVGGELRRAFVAFSHPLLISERVRAMVVLADEPTVVRARDVARLRQRAVDQALGVGRDALMVEPLGFAGSGFEGVRDPRGLSTARLAGTFHVVTMPLAARDAVIQVVEAAGLEIARLVYALPATLASVADPDAHRGRILLMEVGGLTTSIGLFVEGALQALSVLPWGGLRVAETLASELHATHSQAVAWSLEGIACRRPEVRALVEREWAALQLAIGQMIQDQPRPDAGVVSGRGALMDGFAEWIEQATGIPTSLGRSPRTSRLGDVARQVGLSAAVGLLEMAASAPTARVDGQQPLFNRLIDRTRTILMEYF